MGSRLNLWEESKNRVGVMDPYKKSFNKTNPVGFIP